MRTVKVVLKYNFNQEPKDYILLVINKIKLYMCRTVIINLVLYLQNYKICNVFAKLEG